MVDPEQMEPFPVIDGAGFWLTVIVFEPLPVHPLASVTVTVNEFAVPTVIHCVVAPVLHKYEAKPAGAHHCVVDPEQIEPFPVMVEEGS